MKIGLMVFDDDPKAHLAEKVRRAAARYQARYGQAPTACYVNPGMLAEAPVAVPGVDVLAWRTVLPNHLWIGVDERVVAPGTVAPVTVTPTTVKPLIVSSPASKKKSAPASKASRKKKRKASK